MLTQAQLDRFAADGYLVVPDALDDADLAPVEAEYAAALHHAAARMHARGEITATHDHLPFAERYAAIVTENPAVFYYLGISLPLDYGGIDPEYVRAHTGPALFGLLRNPKLLDVAESVLGGEISSNPVQQTRLKPPQRLLSGAVAEYSNIGLTTWHQDFGAVMERMRSVRSRTV